MIAWLQNLYRSWLSPRWRMRTAMLALIVLLSIGLLALAGWRAGHIAQDYNDMVERRAIDQAKATTKAMVDILVATLLQDSVVQDIAIGLTEAMLDGDVATAARLRAYLAPKSEKIGPDIAQIAAIGPSGRALWSNLDWSSNIDLSDREHFRAFLADPQLLTFIGRPVIGRVSDQQTVQYARALRTQDGALRAVIVLSLRVSMLARVSEGSLLGNGGVATLLRDDGLVLMQSNMQNIGEIFPQVIGMALSGSAKQTALHGMAMPIDGVSRFMAGQRIPGFPLTLVVGLSVADQQNATAGLQLVLGRSAWILYLSIIGYGIIGASLLLVVGRAADHKLRADIVAENDRWSRAIMDAMPDGVVVHEPDAEGLYRVAYVNGQAATIAGRPRDWMLGGPLGSLTDISSQTLLDQRLKDAAEGKPAAAAFEVRYPRPDGGSVLVEATSRIVAGSGDLARPQIITVLRDVTEARAQAAELEASRRQVQRIMDVMPGVFYRGILKPGGNAIPTFISPSVTRLFGISVEQAMQSEFLRNFVSPSDFERRKDILRRDWKDGIGTLDLQIYGPTIKGWLRETFRVESLDDGTMELVGFLSNITAEHEATAELERQNWALAAYSQSLAELLRPHSQKELAAKVCESITVQAIYPLAYVAIPDKEPTAPVRIIAHAGTAGAYLGGLTLSWSEDQLDGRGPIGRAVREGLPQITEDIATNAAFAPWRALALANGIASIVTMPCVLNDRVISVLAIYSSLPNAFGPRELQLFQRLSDEVGLAFQMEEDRLRLEVAVVARREAEENLRAVALLGPGVLYRARVVPGRVEVVDIFGELSRIMPDVPGTDAAPVRLARLLQAPETIADMQAGIVDTVTSADHPVITPDGSTMWLRNSVRVSSIYQDGVLAVGYISDVTRDRTQQLTLQKTATLVTLGEMATGIAHELNQPLASIAFASENARMMLGRDAPDLRYVNERLERVSSLANRAGRLIEHMRIFARGSDRRAGPVSWATMVRPALEIAGSKLAGVEVVADIPADLPSVMGGEISMQQILINLLANAADAYLDKPATVRRHIRVTGSVDGNDVVLRVSDRAGGIPPEVQARVFEPFFSTKSVGGGTGLGLALVFGIVTEMGGTIDVANKNDGAEFSVHLPRASM